jgi:hypothetical protein
MFVNTLVIIQLLFVLYSVRQTEATAFYRSASENYYFLRVTSLWEENGECGLYYGSPKICFTFTQLKRLLSTNTDY